MGDVKREQCLTSRGIYRHYKGGLYEVVELLPDVTNGETGWIVVYQALKPTIQQVFGGHEEAYPRYARKEREFRASLGPVTARYERFKFIARTMREALVLVAEEHLTTVSRDYSDADYY